MRGSVALVLTAGLLVAACGASVDEARLDLTADERALAGYFADVYALQSDQLAASAELIPSDETLDALASGTIDEEAYQERNLADTRDVWAAWLAGMDALEPPPAAEGFHSADVAMIERAATEQDALLEDLASPDTAVSSQAIGDFGILMQELVQDSRELQEQGAALLLDVLAGQTHPEAVYMRELLGLTTSERMSQLESFFAGFEAFSGSDPDALLTQLQTGIDLFEAMAAEYESITPPTNWADTHQEQIGLLHEGASLYRDLGALLTADPSTVDFADLEALVRDSVALARRSPQVQADLFAAMSEYFESLE